VPAEQLTKELSAVHLFRCLLALQVGRSPLTADSASSSSWQLQPNFVHLDVYLGFSAAPSETAMVFGSATDVRRAFAFIHTTKNVLQPAPPFHFEKVVESKNCLHPNRRHR
jgi:hypothetical protein